MKLLLDTHVFVWRLASPERLPSSVSAALDDTHHEILVSSASAWEIATKHRLGRWPGSEVVVATFSHAVRELDGTELAITAAHALTAGGFDVPHRDPFDRMLAAQAMIEGATLVSADRAFERFPVDLLW